LAVALTTGCASHDYGPGTGPKRTLRVTEAPGGQTVPPEIRTKFVQRLDSELFTEKFAHGNELALTWKCTEVNPGNRALRYFVGFGAGSGVMAITTTLSDSKGHPLGSRELKGVQTIGFFGGSFDSAIEMAADGTADFAAEKAYPKPARR
jgi:hypothetical protein